MFPSLEASAPVESFDLFARPDSRFAIPDWARVEESLATRLTQEDPNGLWAKVSLCWMHALKESLGDGFRISSSDNFHLLSPGTVREQQVFLEFAEKQIKGLSDEWHSVKPQTPRKAGCRMGGAQRYASSLRAAMMGIAALHPSYGRDVGA